MWWSSKCVSLSASCLPITEDRWVKSFNSHIDQSFHSTIRQDIFLGGARFKNNVVWKEFRFVHVILTLALQLRLVIQTFRYTNWDWVTHKNLSVSRELHDRLIPSFDFFFTNGPNTNYDVNVVFERRWTSWRFNANVRRVHASITKEKEKNIKHALRNRSGCNVTAGDLS